ncbi:hypothetical protein QYE76_061516 [Lolium multiflorum]|uniref:CCHC-type domain-containing protein n=1 Tax=Lolium multiflorum TaxID=4521 RepID=A0AAD8W4S6_LOLMU|nr:hypothetical protein QYE76_061516 [Lolium multiflorum]
MWRRRVEASNAEGPAGWGAPAPEMEGLCFRCFEPGHRKRECANAEVCLRCWQRDHPAKGCTRPRSPSSEDELRNRALAKLARRSSPVRERKERPWPPISVEPLRAEAQDLLVEEALEAPQLCVVRRTVAMGDLEQRLRFAMVASVGGRRPSLSCTQVVAAFKWRGVPENAMSVHTFAPEDFIVIFASAELRDHVASRPPVLVARAPLCWRPWNRQGQAELVPMQTRVSLVLEGIPPHA